jgi:hypothetical protein
MPIFLTGHDLGGGGTALDGSAQLRPAFCFFAASPFDTSSFRFYLCSELGRGQ